MVCAVFQSVISVDAQAGLNRSEPNSARKNVDSRQNSARRNIISPWPTPLSARGGGAGVEGGEGGMTAEQLLLSKSSVDPYSVLHKKAQEGMIGMASEIEALQEQVASARAEANEMKIRGTEAEDRVRLETARREAEEKLRLDAAEREKQLYQQWVDEHEKRKRAEIVAEEIKHSRTRTENEIKTLLAQVDSLTIAEDELKTTLLKAKQEAREASAVIHKLEDENKKLSQNLERAQMELADVPANSVALEKMSAKLKETTKSLQAAQAIYDDKEKLQELDEGNRRLQERIENSEATNKKLTRDLDALQQKHMSAESDLKETKSKLESSHDQVRQLNVEAEKNAFEIKRLRELNCTLDGELEKLRGKLETANARRKVDRAEILELQGKVEEFQADIASSQSDAHREKLTRANQEEREKHLQSAMLETEQRRRELDSRLWLLEERRKHDLAEFSKLREDYTDLEARLGDAETRLSETQRQRDNKTAENTLLQEQLESDRESAAKAMKFKEERIAQLQVNVTALEGELERLRKTTTQLECDVIKHSERGRTLDSESGRQKWQFDAMQDKILDLESQVESENVRRTSAEERERETKQAFTLSQEALRTLQSKFDMTWQEHELLTSQVAKLRQEHSISSAQLKSKSEEIDEAQRLMLDATNTVELEQARRIAVEDRERAATQSLMSMELEKCELENKVWLLEEKKRLNELALEQMKASFEKQDEQRLVALEEVEAKQRELDEVKEKSKELAAKFQLIGNLKKEFEVAERQRSVAEERFSEQYRELEEARETAQKAMETCRELSAKSKNDDIEIERLNLELLALQEKRITTQHEVLSSNRSQENIVKQLRERLRDAEERLQIGAMSARKTGIQKTHLETELAEAKRRIVDLECSGEGSASVCGVGGTFQKSGGGFLVTALDAAHAECETGGEGTLMVGDLVIAIDDKPLADVSSVQFRNSVQGQAGTTISLLVVRHDAVSGVSLAPFDLLLTRRAWVPSSASSGEKREGRNGKSASRQKTSHDSPQGVTGTNALQQAGTASPEQLERQKQLAEIKLEQEILVKQQQEHKEKRHHQQKQQEQQNHAIDTLHAEIVALKQQQQLDASCSSSASRDARENSSENISTSTLAQLSLSSSRKTPEPALARDRSSTNVARNRSSSVHASPPLVSFSRYHV